MSLTTESEGKSKGCNDQLNAQLQILDARLKQAENQVALLGKGLAEVAGAKDSKGGIFVMPPGTIIGAAFQLMATQEGNVFTGAYAAILKLIPTILTDSMSGMLIQLALQQLGTATISPTEISNTVANLNSKFDALKNELAALDPINDAVAYAEKQAQIAVVLQAFASSSTMMTAVTNISQCKSTALKLG